jgi:hypothetical protein
MGANDAPVRVWGAETRELGTGELRRFSDWRLDTVPNAIAGVYTVWHGDELIYVGMGGRSLPKAVEGDAMPVKGPKGLRDRLRSHTSGRRSGDQFCIYVFDRLVLPHLTDDEIKRAAVGKLNLDKKTQEYIHANLSYRYCVLDDGKAALALERLIRKGALSGQRPLLNPLA